MQKGSLYQASGSWYGRYRRANGSRASRYLGSVDHYTPEQAEAELRAFMQSIDQPTLCQFMETYLNEVPALRASTKRGYSSLYHAYIMGHHDCMLEVRNYRTREIQEILNRVGSLGLSRTTLGHLKHFLSGVMRYACQCGLREGNPVTEARIPHGLKPPRDTYATPLEEIQKTLDVVGVVARAAVGLAAYAGLRRSELQGLRWGDITPDSLQVNRTQIRGILDDPKSKASRDSVPIIPQLRALLDDLRTGNPFSTDPDAVPLFDLDLEKLGTRYIHDRLVKVGLKWRGWHAYRRGLASNLAELGVDPLIIQRIMRHSNASVTLKHYIKARDAKMGAAMDKLAERLEEGGD